MRLSSYCFQYIPMISFFNNKKEKDSYEKSKITYMYYYINMHNSRMSTKTRLQRTRKTYSSIFYLCKNFDVDGLKTVIYNEGSSLYDPNILYDIYDIYETMYSQIYMRFTIKNMSMNISPHKRKNL